MAAGRERSLSTLFNTHDSPRPPRPVPRTPGPQVRYMRTIVSQTPPVHALYTIITITNTTPREPLQPSRTALCGGRAERRVTPPGRRAGRLRGLGRPQRRLGRARPAPRRSARAPSSVGATPAALARPAAAPGAVTWRGAWCSEFASRSKARLRASVLLNEENRSQ